MSHRYLDDQPGHLDDAYVVRVTGTFTASHAYATGGAYAVTVTLTDDDLGSVSATSQAFVEGTGVVNGVLYVVGTVGDNQIAIRPSDLNQQQVQVEGTALAAASMFDPTGIERIVILMRGGNDQITIASGVRLPTLIDGGRGPIGSTAAEDTIRCSAATATTTCWQRPGRADRRPGGRSANRQLE